MIPVCPVRRFRAVPLGKWNVNNPPQNPRDTMQPGKLTPAEQWAERVIARSHKVSVPDSDLTPQAEGKRDKEMDEARRAGKPWVHPHLELAKKQAKPS
jgi:hypothetical protein